MKIKFTSLILFLGAAALFIGCETKKKDFPAKRQTVVIVSIPPYIGLVKNLVGDEVIVRSAVPPGFDFHTQEITPAQVKMLQDADLWIGIGEPFEKKLVVSLREAKKNAYILELDKKIPLISYASETSFFDPCAGGAKPANGHQHDEGMDLHFWLSPKDLTLQAEIIAKALSELNPSESEFYQKNLAKFSKRARIVDNQVSKQLAPYQGRAVIVSHPFLGYFCKTYHLHQIAVECEGKSPLPQNIDKLLEQSIKNQVICVVTSPLHNNQGALLIAEKEKYQVFQVDPLQEDPLSTIQQIAKVIANAK